MHRPSPPSHSGRPDPSKLSGVHRKLRRAKKPGWNDTQHDLDEYKPSAQELLERKLRLMSKEQLMRLAGITPPQQQQPVSGHQTSAEAEVGGSSEDKENVKPEVAGVVAHSSKPAKPASTATLHSTTAALHSSTVAISRVSVQSVTTAAPAVSNGSTDTTPATAPPVQHASLLGYRSVLRSAALLSPVLERSIEVELDAEAHADTSIHSISGGEQRQQEEDDDAETHQLIARIDTLTAASHTSLTPDMRAQALVQEVAARMKQLADTPPQISTFSPPTLPPLTPTHFTPLLPSTAPSTPSIHHRLFLLLRQVASHLESLSSRQSADATERASLLRQLEAKDRDVVQLQAKVQALEGGVMLVQRQLLAMQRGYDEQLAGMMSALTRLEQRQAPAAADEIEQPEVSVQLDGEPQQKRTFAVPPPFVSSQQLASPASSRQRRATAAAASLLTPPRSPFASSPMRPASSASFLASPTPPRAGRSPRRIVARWDEVSNLEHRLQAAAVPHTTQPYQPYQLTTPGGHSDGVTESRVEEVVGGGGEEQPMRDLSSFSSSTFSAVSSEPLSMSAKRSGRRSAGWPQHTAGWTVHMR